ncbi:MAG: cation diffusion facilitator family transporter [bacterium]|nr:cation diffusion facilitator family transporter [bacterium]
MTELLVRFFIKTPERVEDSSVREAYGILAGFVGIACNLILCAMKFVIGSLSGSIAIQADAVNNLSDVGSSAVMLIGSKMAGKPADREHPYGHARMEYIAALIIAFFILIVGFELGRESVMKIIAPEPVEFSVAMIAVLVGSILVKLWMSRFTANIGRRINSSTMSAATSDSIADVISTGAILLSSVIGYFKGVNIDGYIGVVVAGFVLYSGASILRDTISPLMGEAPDPKVVSELTDRILSYDGIIGIHDILVHSYGPGKLIASAHAEVRSDCDLMAIHETIDTAEREVGAQMGVMLTLHLDPVEVDNAVLNETREQIKGILAEIDATLRFHDFRMVRGENRTNLLFDIVVQPGRKPEEIAELKQRVADEAARLNPAYHCILSVDVDHNGLL